MKSISDTEPGWIVAYHKEYLVGTMNLIRLVFIQNLSIISETDENHMV